MHPPPAFAPQLFLPRGTTDTSFYRDAFGAVETLRFNNDDGTVHVAEFSIGGTLFHVHEVMPGQAYFTPAEHNGSTVLIGLFVQDVDAVMKSAIAAGATLLSPARNFDYGYRQGEFRDPFGHRWVIEKKI